MSIDTSNSIQPSVVYDTTYQKKVVTAAQEDAQSSFLQLLVSQITNQTPDNTLDATEMISQFAQMNAALGLQKMSNSINFQKLSTATNLINQKVTLAVQNSATYKTETIIGTVTGVDYSDKNGEPRIIVDGNPYSLDSVSRVGD